MFGTAAYVAPEQVTGGEIDGRTDLYSLGCVLFEMLTGRPPFTGGDAVSLVYRHVHESPPRLREVDPSQAEALEVFLARALEKEADRRPPDAEVFNRELREAAAAARIDVTAALPVTTPLPSAASLGETEALPAVARLPAAPPASAAPAPLPAAPGIDAVPPGPPDEQEPRRSRRRRLGSLPLAAALGGLGVLALVLAALLVAAFTDPGGDRPREGVAPADQTEPAPEPTGSQPAPQDQAVSPVADAAQALADTVVAGVEAGEVSRDVAREVEKKLRDVAKELDRGDREKALEHLDDLRDKIEELREKGQISSDARADSIVSAIEALADSIES